MKLVAAIVRVAEDEGFISMPRRPVEFHRRVQSRGRARQPRLRQEIMHCCFRRRVVETSAIATLATCASIANNVSGPSRLRLRIARSLHSISAAPRSDQRRLADHGRPVRGLSHAMILSCGVRRLRGRPCRSAAALVNASACCLDCRFSRESSIHSRMMVRLTFDLAI
jgi:hypothetical protein